MSAAARFRAAVEGQDIEAAIALLAPDAVFRSPAVHRPYEGREVVGHLLRAVFAVFEDFRYTDEAAGPELHALLFTARVGDRELQGVDLIREDGDGHVAELTVMIRPLSGLQAVVAAMGARLAASG